ncbi:MAG: Gfo/Idh/MocA family oxidoreductase [Candidatus Hydrogenedentes bacterium]|nr:Gfo/Idh/MocA family oxidoreductase [Candidatus Hydrogenedentota bacterium]
MAFIGAGRIADLHALGYAGNPDARIYAVCDVLPERAEARRKEWGAEKAFTDVREALADANVHAVEVLTPYDTHEPIVTAAIRAGKHVACQKPLTTSLASADRLLAEAKSSNVVFKITEVYVTYPPLVLAKQLIDEGAIGELAGMRIKYVASPKGGWQVSESTYQQQFRIAAQGFGYETFDHGHHEWAVGWWFLGEPERVCAWVDSLNGILDTPSVVMWKSRNSKRYGVVDFLHAADLHIPSNYYSNDEWFEFTGSRGIILVNRGTGEIQKERAPVSVFDGERWTHHEVPADWGEGFKGSTRNFIEAIHGQSRPSLSGEEGREVLRFGLAVMESARKRREVYIDELERPFPWLYNVRRRMREREDVIVGPRRKPWFQFGASTAKYAPQARTLTESLPQRFDPSAVAGWSCTVSLILTGEGGVPDQSFGVYVGDGRMDVRTGDRPASPDLTLRMPAGTWAAIVLGKKRLETAFFQGKIKFEGKGEEGLKLKSAIGL